MNSRQEKNERINDFASRLFIVEGKINIAIGREKGSTLGFASINPLTIKTLFLEKSNPEISKFLSHRDVDQLTIRELFKIAVEYEEKYLYIPDLSKLKTELRKCFHCKITNHTSAECKRKNDNRYCTLRKIKDHTLDVCRKRDKSETKKENKTTTVHKNFQNLCIL